MKSKINFKILIFSLIIVYLIAFIGGLFTSQATNTEWYESIKPAITPPNWVFPIVWNILFFMLGLSLYFSWINSRKKEKPKILLVFGINFILNILWSILYFGIQNPFYAFIELIFLWVSILIMILVTWKIRKSASYFLWPYLIWVTFAGILNFLSAF